MNMGDAKMVIISMSSYPPESAVEVGKRFLELPALPDYITMKGPYLNASIEEGIKALTIYEFDESRYSAAYGFLADRTAKLFGVPGYTYAMSHWMEARDALKLVGLG